MIDAADADRLEKAVARLPVDTALRTVAPRNYHLTLVFLGDIDDDRRHRTAVEIDRTAARCPNRIGIEAIAPFPGRRGGILAARVSAARALLDFREDLCRALYSFIPERERKRPFQPHITLARRRRESRAPLPSLELATEVAATRLGLFCGYQSRSGYRYRDLHSVALQC